MYYLGYEEFSYNDINLFKIIILDLKSKTVHNVFKSANKDLKSKLDNIKLFDNVSSFVSFGIKRNGVIALDINLR